MKDQGRGMDRNRPIHPSSFILHPFLFGGPNDMKRHWISGLCLLALGASVAPAGDPTPPCKDEPPCKEAPPWHPCHLREWPGKQPIGRGGGVHTFDRAGYSNEQSRCARPSETSNYSGYYVGGGSPG